MKVYIETYVETYPDTIARFGDELSPYYRARAVEVPDKLAAEWKAARDAWHTAQAEMEMYLREAQKT